jgi:hypothetical protein
MIRQLRSWLSVGSLLIVLSGSVGGGSAVIRAGDGEASITSYNVMSKTVRIGSEDVLLSPEAAASLEKQLASFGMLPSRVFGARFVVIQGSGGRPMISTIYVAPPVGR